MISVSCFFLLRPITTNISLHIFPYFLTPAIRIPPSSCLSVRRSPPYPSSPAPSRRLLRHFCRLRRYCWSPALPTDVALHRSSGSQGVLEWTFKPRCPKMGRDVRHAPAERAATRRVWYAFHHFLFDNRATSYFLFAIETNAHTLSFLSISVLEPHAVPIEGQFLFCTSAARGRAHRLHTAVPRATAQVDPAADLPPGSSHLCGWASRWHWTWRWCRSLDTKPFAWARNCVLASPRE